MKDFLGSIGGILIVICVFIGIAFLVGMFVKGGVWLSSKIIPWVSIVAWIVFALNLLIILPLGIFNKTKGISGFGLVISSYVYGLFLLCWSMLLAYSIWEIAVLVIGFFFAGVGVVPVAMLAVLFKGEWFILIQLVIMAVVTYGSRILGYHFAEKYDQIAYENELQSEPYV